jgi:hypothetical protein
MKETCWLFGISSRHGVHEVNRVAWRDASVLAFTVVEVTGFATTQRIIGCRATACHGDLILQVVMEETVLAFIDRATCCTE